MAVRIGKWKSWPLPEWKSAGRTGRQAVIISNFLLLVYWLVCECCYFPQTLELLQHPWITAGKFWKHFVHCSPYVELVWLSLSTKFPMHRVMEREMGNSGGKWSWKEKWTKKCCSEALWKIRTKPPGKIEIWYNYTILRITLDWTSDSNNHVRDLERSASTICDRNRKGDLSDSGASLALWKRDKEGNW